MTAMPVCVTCHSTFFSVGSPPATRCAHCIMDDGYARDGSVEESKMLALKRKRMMTPSPEHWSDLHCFEAFEEEILEEVRREKEAEAQAWCDMEALHLGGVPSPLTADADVGRIQYTPEAPPVRQSSILSVLQEINVKNQPRWLKLMYDFVVTPRATIDVSVLGEHWPFFKTKGRRDKNSTVTPSSLANDLYVLLKQCSDSPKDLIIVNWLDCYRKDRCSRNYGVIPMTAVTDMIYKALEVDGSTTSKPITSYLSHSLPNRIYWTQVPTRRSLTFCQLIPADTTVRLYFDIDRYMSTLPDEKEVNADIILLLTCLYEVLRDLKFPPIIEYGPALLSTFALMTAHRQLEVDKFKVSMHIHMSSVYVGNNHTVMKALYKIIVTKFKVMAPSVTEPFDLAVASRRRVMRMFQCGVQYKKDQPDLQEASRFLPYVASYDFETQQLQKFSVELPKCSDDIVRLFFIHDPLLDESASDVHIIKEDDVKSYSTVSSIAPSTSSVSISTVSSSIRDSKYTDHEWKNFYRIFTLYLQERKVKYPVVSADATLEPIHTMTAVGECVYLNSRGDKFCEYKGRCHQGDTAGTQTGYAYHVIHQVAWQTCFSCRVQYRSNQYEDCVYTFCYGYQSLRNRRPNIYQSFIEQEVACIGTFFNEYQDYFRVVPGKRDKTLYIYEEESALWQCDTKKFIWQTWSQWINCKYMLIVENMDLGEDQVKTLNSWRKEASRVGKVNVVITFITNIRSDLSFVTMLNRKSNLIPILGKKVFDVTTGTTRPRRMSDFFSQCMNFNYVQSDENTGVLFDELNDLMLEFGSFNPEWVEYHKHMFGYFLTGFMNDRGFVLWLGAGCNGKGTVAKALHKVMGEFFVTVGSKFITRSGNVGTNCEAATPTLASLIHARVCMISELRVEEKLAWEKLKTLSAGDNQQCRGIYQDPITFDPQFKLVIQSNHCPQLSFERAAFDRLRSSPWSSRFVPNPTKENEIKLDTSKGEALTTRLLDVFGTWCCEGAYDMYQLTNNCTTTIPRPPMIDDYIEKTVQKADIIFSFIDQKCDLTDVSAKWRTTDMFEAFCAWGKRWNLVTSTFSLTTFVEQVTRRIEQTDVTLIEEAGTQKFQGIRKRIESEEEQFDF